MDIQEYNVKGKRVFVFEHHNLAPIAWNKCSQKNSLPPALITLDHHTDTHLAFLRHLHSKRGGLASVPFAQCVAEANDACSKIKSESDIKAAVSFLRNDEQIDFAIRSGVVSHAYVISHDTNPQFVMRSEEYKAWFSEKVKPENLFRGIVPHREPDLHYEMPENRIISLGNDHLYEMNIGYEKGRIDLSLEDVNLVARMEEISRINSSLFPGANYDVMDNFILDIDLDYFNTVASIHPNSSSVFYELIRRSQIITVATEDWFVEECRLEGEELNAPYLLEQGMLHIERAMI